MHTRPEDETATPTASGSEDSAPDRRRAPHPVRPEATRELPLAGLVRPGAVVGPDGAAGAGAARPDGAGRLRGDLAPTELVPAVHVEVPSDAAAATLPALEAVPMARVSPGAAQLGGDELSALAAAFAPRFELRERLGRGGMGTVYAATQPGTSRVFALKVLDGGRNAKDFERFEREMNLTAQIDHPNVIRIFDYGRLPSGPVYYAMELIRGRTLAELVAQEPALPLTRVVRIMLHAARGLAAAHAVGVVHRDIKPENLMVSDTFGWPDFTRILDFGIARTLGHAASRAVTLTSGGIFLGTPRYAAPELILAGPLTPAADIYSFCCVLYVLLSGKGPFDGADTALAMLEAHVRDAPRPVALAAPRELPPALANLVDAGLAKAPEARPQDFHAVIAILSEVLSELEDADAPAAPHRVRRRTPSLEVAVMRPRDLTPAPQPTLVLPDATPAASAPISGSRPRPATPAQGELPAARGPEASRRKTPSRPADAAGEFRAVPQRLMTPLPLRSVARPPTPSAPIPAVVERPAGAAAGAVDAPRARDAEPAPPADARGGEGTAQATTGPASRERLYLGLLVLSLLALAALLALR